VHGSYRVLCDASAAFIIPSTAHSLLHTLVKAAIQGSNAKLAKRRGYKVDRWIIRGRRQRRRKKKSPEADQSPKISLHRLDCARRSGRLAGDSTSPELHAYNLARLVIGSPPTRNSWPQRGKMQHGTYVLRQDPDFTRDAADCKTPDRSRNDDRRQKNEKETVPPKPTTTRARQRAKRSPASRPLQTKPCAMTSS
jgi:hypothetical protein